MVLITCTPLLARTIREYACAVVKSTVASNATLQLHEKVAKKGHANLTEAVHRVEGHGAPHNVTIIAHALAVSATPCRRSGLLVFPVLLQILHAAACTFVVNVTLHAESRPNTFCPCELMLGHTCAFKCCSIFEIDFRPFE